MRSTANSPQQPLEPKPLTASSEPIILTPWPRAVLSLEYAPRTGLSWSIELTGGRLPQLPERCSSSTLIGLWFRELQGGEAMMVRERLSRLAARLGQRTVPSGRPTELLSRFWSCVDRADDAAMHGVEVRGQVTFVPGSGPAVRFRGDPPMSERVMEIERRWTRLVRELAHTVRYRGAPDELVPTYDAVAEAIERFGRVFRGHRLGCSPTEIAAETGVPQGTVRSWLFDRRVPASLEQAEAALEVRTRVPIDLVHRENTDLARLLGLMAAQLNCGSVPAHFRAVRGDRRAIREIRRLLDVLSPRESRTSSVQQGTARRPSIRLFDAGLLQLVSELTAGARAVPAGCLVTRSEKQEYLRAFFDSCGTICEGPEVCGVRVTKTGGTELLGGMALLLAEFGVLPIVREAGKDTVLEIFEPREIEVFRKAVRSRSPTRRAALERLAGQSSTRTAYSVEHYRKAHHLHDAGIPLDEIRDRLEMPKDTARGWLERGSVPRSVQRLEALETVRAGLPDPTVQGRIVRDLHGSPWMARRIAAVLPLRSFEARMAELGDPAPLRGDDDRIVRWLLCG
jgi:hypothetical protein